MEDDQRKRTLIKVGRAAAKIGREAVPLGVVAVVRPHVRVLDVSDNLVDRLREGRGRALGDEGADEDGAALLARVVVQTCKYWCAHMSPPCGEPHVAGSAL